jgi:hypothetical protein
MLLKICSLEGGIAGGGLQNQGGSNNSAVVVQ